VKRDGSELQYVPDKLKTESPKEFGAICLEAVKNKNSPWLYPIQYVPENLRTAEVCLEAVKVSGGALQYVPENLRTAELCLEAVNNGNLLLDVPENLITEEMCLEVVRKQNTPGTESYIKYVPEKFRTVEVCVEAVKHYVTVSTWRDPGRDKLSIVPEELREEVRRRLEESGK